MALEESGLRLTAEGGSEFESTLRGANDAVEGFGQAAERAASPLDAFGEIATGALRRVGEIAVNALGAAAGAVGGFISDSFAGALEAEQTLTRISSVIESTGSAAGLSVRDVEQLGNEFAHLAGGSDDAVLAIQEMALRLGTVSAEEMPDFIQTTLDLAAATGVDAVAAARTLAVAQEDPISALGRLRKSGILLTEAQEEQIKSMVKAGDSAGAYALLIEQVGEATGGAALANSQTLAGQMEIFKNTLGEAGESIATAFLPILTQLFQNIIGPAVPVITSMANSIGALATEFINFMTGVSDGSDLFGELFDLFGPETATAIFSVLEGFQSLGLTFQQAGIQIMESLVPLQAALGELFTAIFGQMPPAQSVIETVMGAISSAITIAAGFISGTLIPALTSAVEWVTMNWPKIQAVIQSVMDAVGVVIQLEIAYLQNVVIPVFQSVVNWVVANWPAIQATIESVMTAVQTVVNDVITFITSYWQENGATIIGDTQSTWTGIQEFISNAITTVQTVITTVLSAIAAFWDAHGQSITTIVSATWENIQNVITIITTIIGGLIAVWLNGIQVLWDTWGATLLAIAGQVWEAIKVVIQNAVTIIGAILDAWAAILEGDWTALGQALDTIWRTLWSTIQTVLATAVASVIAIIVNAVARIVATFQSVDWGALGQWLIDGIASGISNAIGGLVNAAVQAAQDAFNAAAGWLGAHSPAERTAEGLGRPFSEGFAEGIGRGAPSTNDAARNLGYSAVQATGRGVNEGMQIIDPWLAILLPPGGASSPFTMGQRAADAMRQTAASAVSELSRSLNQAMQTTNPWEAIFGTGGAGGNIFGPGGNYNFGFGGGPSTGGEPSTGGNYGFGGGPSTGGGTGGDGSYGFGGGPATGGDGGSYGYGTSPVGGPPNIGGPGFGGGPSAPSTTSINITVNAQGASPSQTQAAVTRALRDAGQYSDTRLRLRGAM